MLRKYLLTVVAFLAFGFLIAVQIVIDYGTSSLR